MEDRNLEWDGLINARDLGDLPISGGHTRRGVYVRSENVEKLTAIGWTQLTAYGVTTIIDLRGRDEYGPDTAGRPSTVRTVRLPLEDLGDTAFWDVWSSLDGTPMFYLPLIEHFPETVAGILQAIADSDGPVLIHCAGGRDRTGLVAVLLLALAGVAPADIAADHALTFERFRIAFGADVIDQEVARITALMAEHGTTAAASIAATVAAFGTGEALLDAGLTPSGLTRLRCALTGGI